jgi:SAM-dependent methyltransferase
VRGWRIAWPPGWPWHDERMEDETLIDRIRRRLLGPSKATPAPTTTQAAQDEAAGAGRRVYPRDRLHEFWRHPDAPNDPERYREPVERSRLLLEVLSPYLSTESRILEIGPNVGRNLAYLFDAGYRDLTGIEINGDAIALLRESYPELGATATLIVSPVEDAIKDLPDGSFDLVYTMAVLEHIHPDSEWIFGEMLRITRSTLITIEDEHGVSVRHTPRNYRTIFEGLGAREVDERVASEADGLSSDFVARVFAVPTAVGGRVG